MRGKYCIFWEKCLDSIWVGTGTGQGVRGFVMGKLAGYQKIRGGPRGQRPAGPPRSSVNLINHYTPPFSTHPLFLLI